MSIIFIASLIILFVLYVKWPETGLFYPFTGTIISSVIFTYFGITSGVIAIISAVTLLGALRYRIKYNVKLFRLSIVEVFMILLWGYMLITWRFTPTPEYGLRKLQLFLAIPFLLVLTARLFTENETLFPRTLKALGWTGVISLALFMVVYIAYHNVLNVGGRFGRGNEGGIGPLTLSWAAASAIACSTYLLIKDYKYIPYIIPFQLGGLVTMLATGSRGPILALFLGAMYTFLSIKKFFQSVLIMLFLMVLVGIALFFFTPDEARTRLMSAFDSNAVQESGRTEFYRDGLMQYLDNIIFGGGVGSYAAYVGRGDIIRYPHNIVLEFAGETGTIGLFLLFTVFILSFKNMSKLRKLPVESDMYWESKIIQWLFCIGFFNSMVSFDVTNQRNLFCAIGMLAAINRWHVFSQNSEVNFENGIILSDREL